MHKYDTYDNDVILFNRCKLDKRKIITITEIKQRVIVIVFRNGHLFIFIFSCPARTYNLIYGKTGIVILTRLSLSIKYDFKF